MKIGYFDCFAGAGGDMIVAAMLDAGLDKELLAAGIDSLGIDGLQITTDYTKRCGIKALHFQPVIAKQDHHRKLDDIIKIITQGGISQSAKDRAIEIFSSLADAEAAVHGCEPGEVHFHEIGALDTIVDIVSACIGIEALNVSRVYCSRLSVGAGIINCGHGLLPVPAPATAELLKRAKVPAVGGPGDTELLTPTAAAILINFVDEFGPLPAMTIDSVGYGAGSRQSDEFPNLLRLIIGQAVDDADSDTVYMLEANIDDLSGETIAFAMERLFEGGALDVFTTPIQMKHNRPALKISVMCRPADCKGMEKIMFEQGLSLGIRRQLLQRSKLKREFVSVKTEFGSIKIKVGFYNGSQVSVKPEYHDCSEAAKHHKVPLKRVRKAAMKAFGSKEQN